MIIGMPKAIVQLAADGEWLPVYRITGRRDGRLTVLTDRGERTVDADDLRHGPLPRFRDGGAAENPSLSLLSGGRVA